MKNDINRRKKIIDDINSKRLAQHNSFNSLHLTTQAEMTWWLPNEREYVQLERRLQAQTQAYQTAYDRLMNHEIQIQDKLRDLERDYVPIRYISNQLNVKGHIIKKQNHVLGWIPHEYRYLFIQNTT